MGGNPALMFIGMMPFSVEFYNQERLSHEFIFVGLRDPFFTSDADVPKNKTFSRGYSISVRQKFYNRFSSGMWYFAHQLQLTNLSHFSNIDFPLSPVNRVVATASEQTAEYGILMGIRLMQQNDGNGFTIDAFVGYNVGYRSREKQITKKNRFTERVCNKYNKCREGLAAINFIETSGI